MPRTRAARRYSIEIKDTEGSVVFLAVASWATGPGVPVARGEPGGRPPVSHVGDGRPLLERERERESPNTNRDCDSGPGLDYSRITMRTSSTDAGAEPQMNDARPTSLLSGDAFVTALGRIAASNRSPTPWEAGCLYAALCAMAVGDYSTARQNVAWSALRDTTEPPPMQAVPVPTIDELFAALANLEESQGINTWSSRRRSG